MPPMNGNEVIAKLKAAGWRQDRVHGSHHIMVKDGRAVPVPAMASAIWAKGFLPALPARPA